MRGTSQLLATDLPPKSPPPPPPLFSPFIDLMLNPRSLLYLTSRVPNLDSTLRLLIRRAGSAVHGFLLLTVLNDLPPDLA